MRTGISAIERAFELARSGLVRTVSEIKQALVGEGYSSAEISGPSLSKQLRDLIHAAQAKVKAATESLDRH